MENTHDDKPKTDTKLFNSKWHTLFCEEIPESKVPVDNQKDVFKIVPAKKKYRMFIETFAEEERGLHEILNLLWNADENDEIEFRINSWGGLVKEGQNLYNLIKNKFNGRTTTILDAAGYSMGALLFLSGDERIVMEEADLMLHDYSSAAWGKGGEIDTKLKHTSKHLRKFFKKILVDNNFLSQKEFDKLTIGKDYWIDTNEMCKRGMATHVLVNGKKIKAKDYLKNIKKK